MSAHVPAIERVVLAEATLALARETAPSAPSAPAYRPARRRDAIAPLGTLLGCVVTGAYLLVEYKSTH